MSFKITQGKGFHLTFSNGWTASVQFGYGSYCDNRYEQGKTESLTAEVACWPKDGNIVNIMENDPSNDVIGYLSADKVLEFLNKVATQES